MVSFPLSREEGSDELTGAGRAPVIDEPLRVCSPLYVRRVLACAHDNTMNIRPAYTADNVINRAALSSTRNERRA
jgi:hypothetical protein